MTKTKEKKFITRVGVADAHGIESYQKKDGETPNTGMLALRAQLNRQRHAVYYEADVTEKDDMRIEALLSQGKYEKALQVLKRCAKKVMLGKMGNVQASWDLIPNSKLDPWS